MFLAPISTDERVFGVENPASMASQSTPHKIPISSPKISILNTVSGKKEFKGEDLQPGLW
jgi:hypothetical protein